MIAMFLMSAVPAVAGTTVQLKYSPECIFQAVALKSGITINPNIPFPAVYLESKIFVKQFDDAIESQWGFRPGQVLNAYVVAKNEIYLMDEAKYYLAKGRFLDDSLAHELMHYVQVKYEGVVLAGDDFSIEGEAVSMQTWFRETYMNAGISPCEKL